MVKEKIYTAFHDAQRLATGSPLDVALKIKDHLKKTPKAIVLVFDDETGQQIDLDLRGTADAVSKRYEAKEEREEKREDKRGPGRPKLGVVAKEVTLLPQHWDWLAHQPGGASVTLRKLVEEAKKKNAARDSLRQAQDATYKFMTAMAGNLSNYEEALRALFAKDEEKFRKMMHGWPKDLKAHALKLAAPVF